MTLGFSRRECSGLEQVRLGKEEEEQLLFTKGRLIASWEESNIEREGRGGRGERGGSRGRQGGVGREKRGSKGGRRKAGSRKKGKEAEGRPDKGKGSSSNKKLSRGLETHSWSSMQNYTM